MKDGFLKAAAATPKIRVADPAWNALEICKALDSCYACLLYTSPSPRD